MATKDVRVRFAPSPTGYAHIGNIRTALFNWLFARHHNGDFLVRIEDTDRERFKQEYVDDVLDILNWFAINADEEVLYQTQRIDDHKKMITRLLEHGKAYRCFCTQEELDKRRAAAGQAEFFRYDGLCRKRTDVPAGASFTVRFKLPDDLPEVSFDDLIRGTITVKIDQLDDFIIARSDGTPMYNFVVVMDDAHMRITHIIRGEDHISNTPKQILLYQACGFTVPHFAHIPLILGPTGAKLSKRDAVTAVREYKKSGYLPNALFNYLVRLGWSHGDQEIFTREELVSYFSLKHINKSGAIFDKDKLDWVNGVYLRQMAADELLSLIDSAFRSEMTGWSEAQLHQLIELYKERVHTLVELAQELRAVHATPATYAQEDVNKWVTADTVAHVDVMSALFEKTTFTVDALSTALKQLCKEQGVKLGVMAQPIRLALVGKSSSPGIFDMLAALGKDESLARLQAFKKFLQEKTHGV